MNGQSAKNESFSATYCPRLAIKLTLRFDGFSDLPISDLPIGERAGGEETFACRNSVT
jgi:hypothetical protein